MFIHAKKHQSKLHSSFAHPQRWAIKWRYTERTVSLFAEDSRGISLGCLKELRRSLWKRGEKLVEVKLVEVMLVEVKLVEVNLEAS
jgi:hypothetical protein